MTYLLAMCLAIEKESPKVVNMPDNLTLVALKSRLICAAGGADGGHVGCAKAPQGRLVLAC